MNVAFVASIVAFAICAVTFAILYILTQYPVRPFTAYDGTPFPGYSVARQYLTHKVVVGFIALLCLFIILAPSGTLRFERLTASTKAAILAALTFVAALFLAVTVWHFARIPPWNAPMLWAKHYALHAVISPFQSGVAGIVFASYLMTCAKVGAIKNSKLIWGAILVYAGVLVAPGMILPIRLDSLPPGEIESSFFHYSALFNTKTMLAGGQQPTDLGYGIGWNVFFAAIERMCGKLSWADDIRFVQAGNAAYAALSILTLFVWLRSRPLIALATSLLVLPWVHTLHAGIFFPNQTGFRFIFFPAVLLAIGLMRSTPLPVLTWALGVFCGLSALWNFETAIALSGGLIVYLFVRLSSLSLRTIALTTTLFLVGVLTAAILFQLIVGLVFGFVIPPEVFTKFALGRASAIRYFGQNLTPNPVMIVSFALSSWFLVYGAGVRSRRPVSIEIAEGMALATILILWAAYYLVQPDEWNCWSYFLPLSLLAVTAWQVLTPARGSRLSFGVGLAAILSIGMAIGPVIYRNQLFAIAAIHSFIGTDGPPASAHISGVYINPIDRERIETRLSELGDVSKNSIIFSGDTYLLAKFTNRSLNFWLIDPAYVLQTDVEFEELMRQVKAQRPDEILFDKAESQALDNPHRRYFALMRASLESDYTTSDERKGWTQLRRKDL
ncbi:hypothetical protein [Bradyrhizobium sp. AZCC 2230]|uniref:hypothetical protein n=1 Tax=Bradyrhizobium sp. AZCC 2230 TaxID=3117021 RepID=UPI002FF295F1